MVPGPIFRTFLSLVTKNSIVFVANKTLWLQVEVVFGSFSKVLRLNLSDDLLEGDISMEKLTDDHDTHRLVSNGSLLLLRLVSPSDTEHNAIMRLDDFIGNNNGTLRLLHSRPKLKQDLRNLRVGWQKLFSICTKHEYQP
jgi:hypothetical protein